MDSQLISVFIGIAIIVGVPLLEKFIDKVKQGNRHSIHAAPPRRMASARPQPPRPPMHKAKKPARNNGRMPDMQTQPRFVEGARVTTDPISDTPVQAHNPGKDALRNAVIWSEILNNPKFKEF